MPLNQYFRREIESTKVFMLKKVRYLNQYEGLVTKYTRVATF